MTRRKQQTQPDKPDEGDRQLEAEASEELRAEAVEPTVPTPFSKLQILTYSAVAIATITPNEGAELLDEPFGDFVSRYKIWLAEHPDVGAIAKVK